MTQVRTDTVRYAAHALVDEAISNAAGGDNVLTSAERKGIYQPFARSVADAMAKQSRRPLEAAKVQKQARSDLDALVAQHSGKTARDKMFLSAAEIQGIAKQDKGAGELLQKVYDLLVPHRDMPRASKTRPLARADAARSVIGTIATRWGDENIMSGTTRLDGLRIEDVSDAALKALAERLACRRYQASTDFPMPTEAVIATTVATLKAAYSTIAADIAEGFRYAPTVTRAIVDEDGNTLAGDGTKAEIAELAAILGSADTLTVVSARTNVANKLEVGSTSVAIHLLVDRASKRAACIRISYDPDNV